MSETEKEKELVKLEKKHQTKLISLIDSFPIDSIIELTSLQNFVAKEQELGQRNVEAIPNL